MKSYVCKKISKNLSLDGNLNKPEWKDVEKVGLVDTFTGNDPKQATSVKLLWSEEYLYLAFECVDDYINATLTQYNDKLYTEEVVEIFIDEDCDRKTYIEVEVNPLNAVLHYGLHNDMKGNILKFARIDKVVLSSVSHDTEKAVWYVEFAIPFSEFVKAQNIPPKDGDKWLMNLYRIDRPKNGEDEYTTWSPTGWSPSGKDHFHNPEKFGQLVFSE